MGKKIKIRRKSPTAAFSGSLIQQNFGESIDKGYIMWDTNNCTHERRFIMNDYGFAKIDIARGENAEERVEFIKFSNNKRKTKIYITWEDYEENYSVEKENQIKRLVKDKYKCESVRVEFKEIRRDIADIGEQEDLDFFSFEDMFEEWVNESEADVDDDLMKDLLDFSREVDVALEIDEAKLNLIDDWDLNKIEISNILSFDDKPLIIDFDRIPGLTGIFGKNFNGKSNVIKALVWGLYKEIIGGNQSSSKYLVNIYTASNTGYIKEYLTINGEQYRINRQVTTNYKTKKNTFKTKYEKLVKEFDDDGVLIGEKWDKEISDRKTGEQKEVQQLVKDAIGSFDDFTKTSLQAQGGAGDYISQQQQPKNNLISRFFGLETYKLRHDYAKNFFNDVKRKQKDLGNAIEIEDKIKDIDSQIKNKTAELDSLKEEKEIASIKQSDLNDEILELTKQLEKIEDSGIKSTEYSKSEIKKLESLVTTTKENVIVLEEWLARNFKKELPFKEGETIDVFQRKLNVDNSLITSEENKLNTLTVWVKDNSKKKEIDISGLAESIVTENEKLSRLKNKLPTYQGKSCPTCGHVHKKADPEKEEICLEDIKMCKELIEYKEKKIKDAEAIVSHNTNVDTSKEKITLLEQSIAIKKESIKLLQSKIDLINNSQDIVTHNNSVESKAKELKEKKGLIERDTKKIKELEIAIDKFEANKDKVKNNADIQEKINSKNEMYKTYKLAVYNFDKNINKVFGELRVLENNKENFGDKLKDIKNSEKLFKKYSIYLQSVHRDGIPASIIRKKLPIINGKINSILSEVVDFKIELEILANGDIVETFFFSEDKSDALPLASASGSQKFIASIVITEALRYMSRLTKPSIRIIDEGFGTLDEELTVGIVNILNYLRNKYKNVLIITHRNEIKDFADNIIEVVKVSGNLDKEVLDNNPKAGVSAVTIT